MHTQTYTSQGLKRKQNKTQGGFKEQVGFISANKDELVYFIITETAAAGMREDSQGV